MNRTQQSTAIAICLLGLAVLTVGAVFLVREWREEVVARQRLQQENARLRYEIDQLKSRQAALEQVRELEQAQPQLQPGPNKVAS